MGIINDKKHYAYAKKKYAQLKNGSVKEVALIVLRRKGSKDVVVHFDKATLVGKYKNPTVARQIFKKTGAFETDGEEDFYADISKVLMLAGIATFGDGGLVFDKKKGCGSEGDFKVAMRLFKVRNAAFGTSAREDSDDIDVQVELGVETNQKVESLLKKTGGKLPSPTQLITDPGHFFSSIDDLGDLIQALQGSEDEQQLRLLDRLLEADAYISSWSEQGIAPVSDAMSTLSDVTEEEALKEQEEIDQINSESLQEELDSIRSKTESLLMQKTFSSQFASLVTSGQKMTSLSSGHFTLTLRTSREAGGKPVMLVSSSSTFEDQELFDQVAQGAPLTGQFRRSKSGKKVALIHSSYSTTPVTIMKAFKQMGLSVQPIVVESFTDLQAQLQRLKPKVLRQRRIVDVMESTAHKALKLNDVLADLNLTDVFAQFCITEYSVENLGFYLSVEGLSAPPSLPGGMLKTSKKDIFDTYIPTTTEREVNIAYQKRDDLIRLAEAGRHSEMDFSEALKDVLSNLDDAFKRFIRSEEAAGLIVDNPVLRRRFTEI